MTDDERTPERTRSKKKKLKLEKRPLEQSPELDDLPVTEEQAENVKGGVSKGPKAPPYVPVGPI